QGDGSIDFIAHPYALVATSNPNDAYGYASGCTTGAHPGSATVTQRVGACRSAGDTLLVSQSVDRPATDGSDYIEGGGGHDGIFGNLGQNSIVGGSSDFFGTGGACTAANELLTAAGTCNRPDGSNILFGGSGTLLDREAYGDSSPQGHDNNSTVI